MVTLILAKFTEAYFRVENRLKYQIFEEVLVRSSTLVFCKIRGLEEEVRDFYPT